MVFIQWHAGLHHLDVGVDGGSRISYSISDEEWQKLFAKTINKISVIFWGCGVKTVFSKDTPDKEHLEQGGMWIEVDHGVWVENALAPKEVEIPGFKDMSPIEQSNAARKVFHSMFK